MPEYNFKIAKCHRCGANMEVCEFDAVWKMRVDGKLHDVPLFNVPAHKCSKCDCRVITNASDEAIQYWYTKYINMRGLNTWRHKLCRFIMRRLRLLESWFYRGPLWRWRRQRQA